VRPPAAEGIAVQEEALVEGDAATVGNISSHAESHTHWP
jgi:hypothetical protein